MNLGEMSDGSADSAVGWDGTEQGGGVKADFWSRAQLQNTTPKPRAKTSNPTACPSAGFVNFEGGF